MSVLLWHQYVRRGMFFASRKGTIIKDKTTLPSKGVCLALTLLSLVTKVTSWRKKCLFGFKVTFTGLEAKHSFLQEEKVTHLKRYPSLKQRMFHV